MSPFILYNSQTLKERWTFLLECGPKRSTGVRYVRKKSAEKKAEWKENETTEKSVNFESNEAVTRLNNLYLRGDDKKRCSTFDYQKFMLRQFLYE